MILMLLAFSLSSTMGTCSLETVEIKSWAFRHERDDLWPSKWSSPVHFPDADNFLLHVQVECMYSTLVGVLAVSSSAIDDQYGCSYSI